MLHFLACVVWIYTLLGCNTSAMPQAPTCSPLQIQLPHGHLLLQSQISNQPGKDSVHRTQDSVACPLSPVGSVMDSAVPSCKPICFNYRSADVSLMDVLRTACSGEPTCKGHTYCKVLQQSTEQSMKACPIFWLHLEPNVPLAQCMTLGLAKWSGLYSHLRALTVCPAHPDLVTLSPDNT